MKGLVQVTAIKTYAEAPESYRQPPHKDAFKTEKA